MGEVSAWSTLQRELDLWNELGLSATFWWRDDDAVAETEQLRELDDLSRKLRIPVSIAVVPSKLDASLPAFLKSRDNINVFQHGYAHISYAAKNVKKIEVGGERETAAIAADLTAGFQTLSRAFAEKFIPVLVPPWNRIEPRVYNVLTEIGFVGLSSMWARTRDYPSSELLQINTHLDPVHWRKGRGFIGEYRALAQVHRHLYARRTGLRDTNEPTGILTHHLDQNEAVWAFCERLFDTLNQHCSVQWLDMQHDWPTH